VTDPLRGGLERSNSPRIIATDGGSATLPGRSSARQVVVNDIRSACAAKSFILHLTDFIRA
jgi:hypothetical protein